MKNVKIFDTHCHLQDFKGDAIEVWKRAQNIGVRKCVIVGTNPKDATRASRLVNKLPGSFLAVGIHPVNSGRKHQDLTKLEEFFNNPKLVALGETGLDYYRPNNPAKKDQFSSFFHHLDLARELNLPVIVHIRPRSNRVKETNEIYEDLITILRKAPNVRCIIHCFVGTADHGIRLAGEGHYISYAGNLTHDTTLGQQIRESAKSVPTRQLLIETDAPYLRPKLREGRNEPAFIVDTLTQLARSQKLEVDKIAPIIWSNSHEVYFSKNRNKSTQPRQGSCKNDRRQS